jgi:hypothetical protein
VLGFTAFPKEIWRQIWSNNHRRRLNREIRPHDRCGRRLPRPRLPDPPRRSRPGRAARRLDRRPTLPRPRPRVLARSRLTLADAQTEEDVKDPMTPQALTALSPITGSCGDCSHTTTVDSTAIREGLRRGSAHEPPGHRTSWRLAVGGAGLGEGHRPDIRRTAGYA